ncbi:MAG: SEL1-like repeat protein [Verrucomicrobiota bacterium]|nr:SEL1-like repeat protein [Verrucomicrobiota bacterium]
MAKPSEHWTPSVDYKKVIQFAKEGSPYYQGLLAICLRSGEFGSIVNIDLSRQWSEVAYKNAHPFGSYNLANISMLEGDFGKATEYYQDAALLLERKASDGDPISMYCMGEIDFQVIPTNVPRALEWFKKSAELGYSQAQATLGAFYLKGLPGLLEKDSKQGIELLAKAVRNKSLTARYNLGMAYLSGDGVPEDKEKAVQWLRVAEGQNFSEAQFTLGVLLIEGQEGVEKNTNEGLEFLRKAATNKHQLAKQYLEKRLGGDFSKNATRIQGVSQISTSDKETIAKAKKLFTGVGSEKDYSKAFQLFFPLAEGGNPEAARFVGLMKFSGKGTDKNFDEARQWLSVASQKGDKTAKDLLQKYKTLFE